MPARKPEECDIHLMETMNRRDLEAAVVRRDKQLLIDFLCSSAGGPLYYTGRDMKTSHKGMKVSENDWSAFLGHRNATLQAFQVPQAEREEVVTFVQSTKPDIVEA